MHALSTLWYSGTLCTLWNASLTADLGARRRATLLPTPNTGPRPRSSTVCTSSDSRCVLCIQKVVIDPKKDISVRDLYQSLWIESQYALICSQHSSWRFMILFLFKNDICGICWIANVYLKLILKTLCKCMHNDNKFKFHQFWSTLLINSIIFGHKRQRPNIL